MTRKLVLSSLAVLFSLGISSAVAHADDSITFSLASPTQSVSSVTGGTLTFNATVAALNSNVGDLFLNSDVTSVLPALPLNDDGFVNNFFPLTFSHGTTETGVLFTLTVPAGTSAGDYLGHFDLYGGGDFSANTFLGTVNFDAKVSTPNAVPEPSSLMLLGTGMMGALGEFKRRRSKTV